MNIAQVERTPEKLEQYWADDFILKLGGEKINFSQARRTMQTPGIPDRRYRALGHAFWWEMKAEDGQLSKDQYAFLQRELACGCLGGCGMASDLAQFVLVLRKGDRAAIEAECVRLREWWVLTESKRRKAIVPRLL